MARHYYLGPWEWRLLRIGVYGWGPPPGTVDVIDFRPMASQAAVGGTPFRNVGLFVTSEPLEDATGFLYLGDDYRNLLTPAERAAWATRLGLPIVPTGPRLGEVVYQTLTIHADPVGLERCPPLLPDSDGFLRFEGIAKRLTSDDPEWVNVRDRVRLDYRRIRTAVQNGRLAPGFHRKFLGAMLDKLGLARSQRAAFIPPDLPDEEADDPDTTRSDNFNRTNSSDLGDSSEGWSWAIVQNTMEIASNQARSSTLNGECAAVAATDLSSTDHYCQAVVGASSETGSSFVGTLVRKDSSETLTWYVGFAQFNNNTVSLYKNVSNSYTELTSGSLTLNAGTTYTVKTQINGSTLKLFVDGAEQLSITDTSITTGTRGGIDGFRDTEGYASWDDWTASDLEAGSGVTVNPEVLTAAFSLNAPSLTAGLVVALPPWQATFSVPAPTVAASAIVAATPATALWNLNAPTVTTGSRVVPTVLSATFEVQQPTVIGVGLATPFVLTATFSVQAPTIVGSAVVIPTPATATFTAQTPTIIGVGVVHPTVLTATFAIQAPAVLIGIRHVPTVLSAAFSLQAPTVKTGVVTVPTVLSATFSIMSPAVAGSTTAFPAVASATFSILSPTTVGSAQIKPTVLTATFTLGTAIAIGTKRVTVTTLSATFTVHTPTIVAPLHATIIPVVLSVTFTILSPLVITAFSLGVQIWRPQRREIIWRPARRDPNGVPMATEPLIKHPNENRLYGVTFGFQPELADVGEILTGPGSVSSTPSGLDISNVTIQGSRVRFRIAGGTDGVDYILTVSSPTSGGNTLAEEVVLKVRSS